VSIAFPTGETVPAACFTETDVPMDCYSVTYKALPEGRLIAMGPFLYRCPNTGKTIQGYSTDDVSDDSYESLTCPACRQVHFVNSKTGKVVGEDDE
jgi:hypothetical protein